MDEEELQKRFTDCVYFLASPLTCKKGIECEYRHSEIARLNPRDCWYWLGGCCFNPDCAFRHPPLEGLKEAYHHSNNPNNGPDLPADKTNIPCYFYSKGFCNKGDSCSFLHEKTSKEVIHEKKLSAGSNTGSTPIESHPDPPVDTEKLTSAESSESPDTSATECEENVVCNEFVQSESDVFNEQRSDHYEEFDVLVEGESERLGYDDHDHHGVDCFSVHDEEYDHAYSELGNPWYDDVYDDRLDNKISGQSRESIFYRLSFQKKNLPAKPIFNSGQRGPDLREHLKKRKVVDFDHSFPSRFSKGFDFDFDRRIRRNFRSHGFRGEVDFHHRGMFRNAVPVHRYRKPQFFSSRKPDLQHKRKFQEKSTIFTGPKTLDQIKEEKKKAPKSRGFGSFNRTGSDAFQGPRPLSEILKNKRKLD